MSLKKLKHRLKKVLRTKPRKFQAQGIREIERNDGRVLLGDDMGLGKTIQVLGYLALHPEKRPSIVVCPANAKYGWEDQLHEHTKHLACQVLSGQKPYKITEKIIIINYDILPYWGKTLIDLKPKALIMDESHHLKNRKIKRTQVCKEISRICDVVIPMSGTPIINRPSEFFPVLNMINPKEFSSFWKYAFRYCEPRKAYKGRGWVFNGAKHTEELCKRVQTIMIRRMKENVLTELPPTQRIPIYIDLDNRKEYEQVKNNFLSWYKQEKGKKGYKKAKKAQAVVKLGQLRKTSGKGKITAQKQWIDDYLESNDGKLVIFCYHQEVFIKMCQIYKKIAAFGGKSGKQRNIEVKKFQTDPKCRLFIGTIKADKEAITLTAASAVVFLELGWTPGEHDQAEDRINRIGQMADSVTAYYLLGRNTIDEHVWNLIEEKRRILAQVLDGEKVSESAMKKISLKELIIKIHKKEKKK